MVGRFNVVSKEVAMESGLAFERCGCQYSLKQKSNGISRLSHTVESLDVVISSL